MCEPVIALLCAKLSWPIKTHGKNVIIFLELTLNAYKTRERDFVAGVSQDVGVGTPPGHASLVHMFEAAAGNWGSRSAVSAPAVRKVMGGAQE